MTDRTVDEVITDLADDLKDLVDLGADIAVDLSHKVINWFAKDQKPEKPEGKFISNDILNQANSLLKNLDPETLANLIKAASAVKGVKK